jgi:hypothetical protein
VDIMTQPIPSPIGQWVSITFIADANSPADVMQWAGKTYLIDPATMTALGSGPSDPGKLLGVRGYRTTAPDGSAQWLMTSPVPPAVLAAFNAMPGANGWLDETARATYRQVGLTLLEQYGMPAPDVLSALQHLYDAAVANYTTPPAGG